VQSSLQDRIALILQGISPRTARAIFKTRVHPLLSESLAGDSSSLTSNASSPAAGRTDAAKAQKWLRALLEFIAGKIKEELRILVVASADQLFLDQRSSPKEKNGVDNCEWPLTMLEIVHSVVDRSLPQECLPSIRIAHSIGEVACVAALNEVAKLQGDRGQIAKRRIAASVDLLLGSIPEGLQVPSPRRQSCRLPLRTSTDDVLAWSLQASVADLLAFREQLLRKCRSAGILARYGVE